MPNWTTNIVTVYGAPKEVRRFMKAVKSKEGHFDFNSILPEPMELRHVSSGSCVIRGVSCREWFEIGPDGGRTPIVGKLREGLVKKYGAASAYDWHCKNWGTKWNACHEDKPAYNSHTKAKAEVIYRFDTAWAPPIPVYEAASKKFPNVTIDVYEEGEGDGTWHEYTFKEGVGHVTDQGEVYNEDED